MSLSLAQGFAKSIAMTVLSEIGDKTFFAAAILAMRHPRRLVLSGCLSALIVMTIFSAVVGWAAPNLESGGQLIDGIICNLLLINGSSHMYQLTDRVFWGNTAASLVLAVSLNVLPSTPYLVHMNFTKNKGPIQAGIFVVKFLISREWSHHVSTLLFMGFGLWSLWDVFKGEGEGGELAEVEEKLGADSKASNVRKAEGNKDDDDDLKKERWKVFTQFFSPIFLKAFSITFFGEWGDKSQLATIGLAADENPFGVVLGGVLGQAFCTTAAVIGGKSFATQISERIVALSSGVLFILFGIQSFLSIVES